MILGFTGTQAGMSSHQRSRLRQALIHLKPKQFHHGGCIGADTEASHMAHEFKRIIVVKHPPTNTYAQGESYCDEETEPLPFLVRNHVIVDESDALIACPESDTEQVRSGTWATVRYARKQGRMIYIIRPDGKVERESPHGTIR